MKPRLSILTLVLASVAWGQTATQPGSSPTSQPARHLKFQVEPASEVLPWKGSLSPEQIIHPTHAAMVMVFDGDTSSNQAESWIQQSAAHLQGISEKQKAFLRQQLQTSVWGQTRYVLPGPSDYNLRSCDACTLYAVSEQDARQMAILFIEHLDKKAQGRLDAARGDLQKSIDLLEQAPPKIEELAAQEKQLTDRIVLPERNEGSWTPRFKAVEDANAALKALDVERAGQVARLRKIQEYMAQQTQPATSGQAARTSSTQPDPAIQTTLETMLVQLNVEMVGTEARRAAVEKDSAWVREMVELHRQLDVVSDKKGEWEQKLTNARYSVQHLPQTLANPPATMRPALIMDDTIRIATLSRPGATQPAEPGGN